MSVSPIRVGVRRACLCACAIAGTTSSFFAFADQSSSTPAEQVTVLGQRLSNTAPGIDAARSDAARVAGGANIVGVDEYSNGRASNLLDVFAMTPGVFVQSRFGAEEARLSIRGSGLQRTFHMRGINLLQDGVPITLADGSGDFQAIEPLALAYTQVMRGANALEYGSTTLGGSVNFISPSGFDGAGFHPRLEGGSFSYRRGTLSYGAVNGNVDYFASAAAYEQDGYRDWSHQENKRAFGNIGIKVREGLETRFFLAAVNTDSELPGSLTKAQLESDPTQANASSLAGRQQRNFDLYRIANHTVLSLNDGFLELTAGYSDKDLFHPIFQVLRQRSHDYNVGARYVSEGTLVGHNNRVVVGVAPSWNRVEDNRFVNISGQPGAPTASSEQHSKNFVAYGENQFALTPAWTLVTGAQWTDAKREYDDFFLSNGDQGLDATYNRVSPKLGVLWRVREEWTVFANLSDSFEAPSFGELTGGPGVNLLDAQTARTVEIGSRGTSTYFTWDLAAYNSRVRNELLGLNAPNGDPLGTVNAPRTTHRGIEAGVDVKLMPALTWRSAYLLNDFKFDNNASYGNNTLPGVPKHFYRGELKWTALSDYYASLNTEWSPERYAIDMASSWFADSYAVWGAKIGRTQRSLSWFIEGRNLADRRYASTTGVIADALSRDAAQFLPADGRSFFVGLDWKTP
jgi:iron complex outermembrane receptor protein